MRISFAKGCKLMSTLWLIVALPVSGMIVYFAHKDGAWVRLALWRIVESGEKSDFYWNPEEVPDIFVFEPDSVALRIFRDNIASVAENAKDEIDLFLDVARYVQAFNQGEQTGPAVRWDSPSGLLRQVGEEGRKGNCFHYSILYATYMASLNGKARLWALEGADGPGGRGHSVAEVYSESHEKWIMIDVFWDVVCWRDEEPLSVLEIRELLLKNNPRLTARRISTGTPRDVDSDTTMADYKDLVATVLLRTANDFERKYRPEIRYGAGRRLSGALDRLPSAQRRGLEYVLGRNDALMHFTDDDSPSMLSGILLAKLCAIVLILTATSGFGLMACYVFRFVLRNNRRRKTA
jgi:hypothetical protein